ncbi:hypothetical protein SAMN05421858_0680 [Haladaptatus litoreus]|uniref:Uncharacterized protein n=1 Tax=Haladaptatus litoreus TaxID=553468 RepID=A0A1N6WDC0_9EURY|nr:hypothetical protein [Haladaptatus litoreus]SIQ88084.1 hypothetical protein SAMN05421858_0680 [Haladaptatus litoreus]
MVSELVSSWLPNRPPTWVEVGTTVLCSIGIVMNIFPSDSISWNWVVAGFVLFAVTLGPASNSSFGKRVGSWFRGIGVGGRVLVIVLYAVGVLWALLTFDLPTARITSFIAGLWLAIVLFQLAHVADAGEIDEWKAT